MLGRATHFVLNLGSTVILARLLAPSDFGLVAMVSAIAGFLVIFRDAGLSTATIRQAEITHAQTSMLFWANVTLSVLVAVAIAGLAPVIAWLYGRPELSLIASALASSIFLGGLGLQHGALLKRQLRLVEVNVSLIVSQLTGIATAIVLAALGAGYWALVAKNVVDAAMNSALLWIFSGWRPGAPSRGSGVGPLIKFGSHLTGTHFLGSVFRRIDDVVIGWAWGPTAVGLYSRAYSLFLLPASEMIWPVSSVVIPALSALQGDPERFRRYYRKALEMVSFFGYAVVVLLIVAADEAVLIVLGEQWLPAVDILRMLGPAMLLEVSSPSASWVYVSYGRSDRQLKWTLMVSPLLIIGIVAGLPWGGLGVAAGVSASRVAQFFPALLYCYHGTPFHLRDFFAPIWRSAIAAIGAGALLYATESTVLVDLKSVIPRFAVMSALYCLFYLAIFITIPGGTGRILEILTNTSHFRSSAVRRRIE